MAVRLNPAPGEDRVAWTYKKGTGYIPNTILYGDYLYFMTDAGLLTCVDAVTGKPQYESKRFPDAGAFRGGSGGVRRKTVDHQPGWRHLRPEGGAGRIEILGTNSLGEGVVAPRWRLPGIRFTSGRKRIYIASGRRAASSNRGNEDFS